MPVSLVVGIYTLWLLWKCRCRVKAKRKRSKSNFVVDKIPITREVEIDDTSPNTVPSYFTFCTNSATHGHMDLKFKSVNNEKNESKTKTDRVEDSFLSIRALKTTKAKPLVQKQFASFFSDPYDKDHSSMSNFVRSSTSTGSKLKEKFQEKNPLFGKVKGTNSLCTIDQTETFASAAQSFAQYRASAMEGKLLSASSSSWASGSNDPVNAWTYVRPDKLPLISTQGVIFKDIDAENLKPPVEDDENKSPPLSGAEKDDSKSSEVGVNDVPSVGESYKEPGISPPKDPPIMFKFTSQNSGTIPKPVAVFSADRSNFSETVNTRPSGSQNKLKSSKGSCIPTSTFKRNKAMPGFSFGTVAFNFEPNESNVVFGSATPAFNTGSKLPVPVTDELLKSQLVGLSPHTTSVEELKGNIINQRLSTFASSHNTKPTLNSPHRRDSTASKKTSNVIN